MTPNNYLDNFIAPKTSQSLQELIEIALERGIYISFRPALDPMFKGFTEIVFDEIQHGPFADEEKQRHAVLLIILTGPLALYQIADAIEQFSMLLIPEAEK